MLIDTQAQAFIVPQDKREKFSNLRETILGCKASVALKSIQKVMGKCSSFSKFYVREMAAAIGKAGHGGDVTLTQGLRKELEFWRFLDTWDKCIPRRHERHVSLLMSTDASLYRWSAIFHFVSGNQEIGDYWEEDVCQEHINVKELSAVLQAVRSLPASVRDCRIDARVDNQVTINSWHGRGPKSAKLSKVARLLFEEITERNLLLEMNYIPSGLNSADYYSRQLTRSDAMLSATSWDIVQVEFGGPGGHNLDLMALDSNAQYDFKGVRLPHFTPFSTPCSAGVNVFNQDLSICDGVTINAYVFPPFVLIGPLLRFLQCQRATVTFVAPRLSPLRVGWPIMN